MRRLVIVGILVAAVSAVESPASAATCTGLSSYDNAVLQDAPVGYWRLGETGTSVTDCAGLHSGTYKGGPAVAVMPNGNPASDFSGNTRYVEIADANDLSVKTAGVLTIEAWLRPDSLQFAYQEGTGYVHWMGKGVPGQHEYASRMYSKINSENRPNRISGYAFNLGGGLGAGSYFQDTVVAGQWIHYALVINTATGKTKLYKNGVLRDTDNLSDYNIVPGNGTAPFRIGTRDFNSFFDGAIGKVAVYKKELSQARLQAHYSAM